MAKQPQFQPQIDPSGAGPMMVVPSYSDAPGRALAGAGHEIARLGGIFAAKRQQREAEDQAKIEQAQEETRRLTAATRVADYKLQATRDFLKIRDDALATGDPDKARAHWDQNKATLEPVEDDAVSDEVAQVRRQVYDAQMTEWEESVNRDVRGLAVAQAKQSVEAGFEQALELGDANLYRERLAAVGPIIGWSQQNVADSIGRLERGIARKDAMNDITAATLAQGTHAEQVRFLKATAKPPELDEQEWVEFRDGLFAKLDVEQAAAAQEERLAAQAVDQNDRRILADAWSGKLDAAAALKAMEEGHASAAVVNQALTMARQGPRQEDDRAVVMDAERWLTKVRAKPARRQEALTWLKEHSASFTDATWKGLVRDIERAGDPADPMGDPLVKLLDELIDENLYLDNKKVLRFGDAKGPDAERAYIDAKQRFRHFVVGLESIDEVRIRAEYDRIFEVPQKVGILRRISQWLGKNQAASGYGTWGPSQFNAPEATLTDPSAEPATQEQFEAAVKAFIPGSPEQAAYYGRWASKWQ